MIDIHSGNNFQNYVISINNATTISGPITITLPLGSTITSGPTWVSGTTQISFDDIELAVPIKQKKINSDGCSCKKCEEYYQYAEAPEDGKDFVCYRCRMIW